MSKPARKNGVFRTLRKRATKKENMGLMGQKGWGSDTMIDRCTGRYPRLIYTEK